MTRRRYVQQAVIGAATVAFAFWIIGAAFMLLNASKSRRGVKTEDTGSNPSGVRLLSPVEKRLTHLASLVSELRQEIVYRRRRVAESDEQLARLRAQLDGGLLIAEARAVAAVAPHSQQSPKFNPKRHLMDIHGTLDPVLDKTSVARAGTWTRDLEPADKKTDAPGARSLIRPSLNGAPKTKIKPQVFGCRDIQYIPDSHKEHVGSGFTKEVQRVVLADSGQYVALKTPLRDGPDVKECTKFGMNIDECFRLANFKVLKEIAMLQQLQHLNIIKVLGFCLPGKIDTQESSHITSMVTEYGEPITFFDLLKMSWEDRLRISLGVSRLLFFLSNSTLGSLAIHDFKPSQFVRVDGEIKLVDLDDVDDRPTTCRTPVDCALRGKSSTVYLSCIARRCQEYSDRKNVHNAYKVFFILLPYETPAGLRGMVTDLVNKTGESLIGSQDTYQRLQEIVELYRSGEYLNYVDDEEPSFYEGPQNAYGVLADTDLPEQGDFWCTSSLQMGGPSCVLTAFDENEARRLCDQQELCTAFVMTPEKTWAGRSVIYLKKGTGHHPAPNPGHTLYVQMT